MPSEILGLNGDISLGSWSGSYTSVEKIASADDGTTTMSANTVDAPTTFEAALESTSYTNVDYITIRGRLRYVAGKIASVTLTCKDSGGTTLVTSAPFDVVGDTWANFSGGGSGSWSQATINGAKWCITFNSGDGMGVDALLLTSGETEVQDAGGSTALTGTVNGVCTTSGSLSIAVALTGVVSAISAVSGDMLVDRSITGAVAAIAAVSGSISIAIALAGTVSIVASVSASGMRDADTTPCVCAAEWFNAGPEAGEFAITATAGVDTSIVGEWFNAGAAAGQIGCECEGE